MWTLAFGQHEDRTPTHGYAVIAKRIIELAKAGERNPDLLSEQALDDLRSKQVWIARKSDAM